MYFLWDTDLTGFGCKVTPSSRKVYVLQYRLQHQSSTGAPKRLTLGKYGELTPEQARKLAAELLLEVKAGGDPSLSRRRSGTPTVSDLMRRFLEEYLPEKKRPPRASTCRSYESLIRCHVLPSLARRRVAEVSTADIERLHRRLRSTPSVANRTLSVIQHAVDRAETWDWRPQATTPPRASSAIRNCGAALARK